MRDDFGVSLGREFVAFFDQLFLQAEIVLHDPVVHDHNLAGAVAVRMRVLFRRASMRGPACVADAIGTVQGFLPDHFFQIAQLALSPAQLQAVRGSGGRSSRRVIATTPPPPHTLTNERDHALLTDVADNATLGKTSKPPPARFARPRLTQPGK